MKTLAVGLLAVLVVVEDGPLLLVAALALSAVGDAFLSRDGDKAFLGGLASFLAAHLVYIALFLTRAAAPDLRCLPNLARRRSPSPWRLVALVMLGLLWRRVKPGDAAADPGLYRRDRRHGSCRR